MLLEKLQGAFGLKPVTSHHAAKLLFRSPKKSRGKCGSGGVRRKIFRHSGEEAEKPFERTKGVKDFGDAISRIPPEEFISPGSCENDIDNLLRFQIGRAHV